MVPRYFALFDSFSSISFNLGILNVGVIYFLVKSTRSVFPGLLLSPLDSFHLLKRLREICRWLQIVSRNLPDITTATLSAYATHFTFIRSNS